MYANASRVKSSNPPIKIAVLEEEAENTITLICWSILLFLGHLISIFSGIATLTSFTDFENKGEICPLFANFSNFSVDFKNGHVVDFVQNNDTSSICTACRYIAIICSLGAGLVCLICMLNLNVLKTSWKFRAFMMTPYFLFFGLSISITVLTFAGFSSFCSNFQKFANQSGNDLMKNLSCETLKLQKWKESKDFMFSMNTLLSKVGASSSLFGWGFGILSIFSFRGNKNGNTQNSNGSRSKEVKIEMKVERARGHSECSAEGLLVAGEKKGRKNQISWPCRMHI